ncbi:MAG TPA: NADH-quinone oxidoreductase subunit H [Polyangia bacterium]|jgi:formate hydrogenlyase subunit 4
MRTFVDTAAHVAFLLLLPPLVPGVIAKVKAWCAGRQGPPLWQPYFDLAKLLRKGAVYSETTTWVFRAGPIVALASCLAAGLLLPLTSGRAPLGNPGDLVLFAYLLGLGRFFTMAAALDTGSAFEGMGASREAAFSALAEPGLFLALIVLALDAGSLSLADALGAVRPAAAQGMAPVLAVAGLALGLVLLAENSRIPFDDPNTHLELTMVHEVMVLDHSGPDLAFIFYGAAVKLTLFAALLAQIALPIGRAAGAARLGLIAGGVLGVAVAVGVIESVMARVRLPRVPQLLVGASVLAAFGAVLLFAQGLR